MYHPLLQIHLMTDDTFTILRSGFDTLEIAYRCAIPEAFLLAIDEAKSRAELSRKEEPLTYFGETFLVAATGASGGYAYVINTGSTKAIWCFRSKSASSNDPWRARVKIRAYCLALKGLIAAKTECDQFLSSIGATYDPNDARVSRADYAVDVHCPNFKAKPETFVVSARTTKTENIERSSIGDRCNYLRIGKLPGKQLCVYDKGAKVKIDNDLIWLEIFKKAFEEKQTTRLGSNILDDIWRFELRAGSKFLTTALGIRRWDKFVSEQRNLLLKILDSISLRIPGLDSNRSRWTLDPRWGLLASHVRDGISAEPFGPLSPRIVKMLRDEFLEGMYAQIAGCILTTAAAEKVATDKLESFVTSVSRHCTKAFYQRDELEIELLKRQKRISLSVGDM